VAPAPAHPGSRQVTFYRVERSVIPGDGGRIARPPVALLQISE